MVGLGGATAAVEVFGDGSIVALGSAGHPFGVASLIFRHLGFEDCGLELLHSEYPMAHPFDDAPAAISHRDVREQRGRCVVVDSSGDRQLV